MIKCGLCEYGNKPVVSIKYEKPVPTQRGLCALDLVKYRGADKSLARPGRKQANVSVRMA